MRVTTYLSNDPAAPLTAVAALYPEANREEIQRRYVLDLGAPEFHVLLKEFPQDMAERLLEAMYAISDEELESVRNGIVPDVATPFRNEASAAGVRAIGMMTGSTFYGEDKDALVGTLVAARHLKEDGQ